jgi:dolichyl-phosphate-mannose-protein mannosyltransferase
MLGDSARREHSVERFNQTAAFLQRQIHLVCNPVVYYTGTCCLLLFSAVLGIIFILWTIRLDRLVWDQSTASASLILVFYLINYVPSFLTDRQLFLFHYYPALVFKVMLIGAVAEMIHRFLASCAGQTLARVWIGLVLIWTAAMVVCFWWLMPLGSGTADVSLHRIRKYVWKESWYLLTVR